MITPAHHAIFSPDRRYRYQLGRRWNLSMGIVNFIMLNPSIADESVNDPTITRCIERAKRMGYGGIIVTNLFALVSTDPKTLYSASDPVGPYTDDHIFEVAFHCHLIICGWGQHGILKGRGQKIEKALKETSNLHYLRMGKNGQPYHPLYLPYDLQPVRWE